MGYAFPMPHPADPNAGPDDWDPEPEAGPPASDQREHHAETFSTSVEVGALFEALAAAQGGLKHADKSRENTHLKSKYATLADCLTACREPLSAAGLAVMQPVKHGGGAVTVSSILGHKSGQWIRCDIAIPLEKPSAQTIGSAITYGRRYGLCALVGIAPDDDDDGAAATDAAPKSATRQTSGASAPEYAPAKRKVDAKWKLLATLLRQKNGTDPDPAEWASAALGHDPVTADDLEHLAGLIDDEVSRIRAQVAQNRSQS